jgi:serine/threonine protein kinase
MATLRAGDKVGKYELLHPVGEGGMGEVWVGRLRSIGGFESYVAIKVIHGRFALDKRFRDMFLDEARVSAVISHPNVVATYDLAVEGEMLYQVLEYVDGDSLAGIQAAMEERQEKMPLPVALRIGADVCAGLHAAHELTFPDGRQANIVHRDVSPQNVLLGVNGAVKLIDFGVALMQDRLAQDSQGTLKGKLRYMPPEQARGEKVDRRADVYAVGAVLYEMISGRLPFDDRTEALYFRALIQGDPPRAPARRRAVRSPRDRAPRHGSLGLRPLRHGGGARRCAVRRVAQETR